MTYTHLTMNEVTMIRLYWTSNVRVSVIVDALRRSRSTIYKIYHYFDVGKSLLDYCNQYHLNKSRCGRNPIHLPSEQAKYIKYCITKGWMPVTIIGLYERNTAGGS